MFEELDEAAAGTGMTARELAERLSLPVLHLESLLDSVVALGLLDRVVDDFKLNDAARRYLLVDGAASMAGLIPVAPGPHVNWTRLADTVRSGRPAAPIDDDPAAFYVPLVEGTFTTMWRCATRADQQMRYSALAAPRILDLGAGGAPWSIAMLEACGDGRAVVNDLRGVTDVARRKTAEHGVADRCEFLPATSTRSRSKTAPTTSSCSATSVEPRVRSAHAAWWNGPTRPCDPRAGWCWPTTSSDPTTRPTRTQC